VSAGTKVGGVRQPLLLYNNGGAVSVELAAAPTRLAAFVVLETRKEG